MATANVTCVLGAAGTGKSQRVVERVAELLVAGEKPSDVLVFCASPIAADALRARIASACAGGEGHGAAEAICTGEHAGAGEHSCGGERAGAGVRPCPVRVTTPREYALGLLASEDAVAWTGRDPRLLTNYEVNVLMEDVKASGVKPHRLKEMLKFLYRGWTELADDDPAWLCTEEEQAVHRLLGEGLSSMRAIMEPELANVAVHYLRANPNALAAARVANVLVDDAQTLSLASQTLCEMLADRELVVTGDPMACAETFESYPHPAWLEALCAAENVQVERLATTYCSHAVAASLAAMRADADQTLALIARAKVEDAAAARARDEGRPYEEVLAELELRAGEKPVGEKPVELGDHAQVAEPGDHAQSEQPGDRAVADAVDAALGGVELMVFSDPDRELSGIVRKVASALGAGVPADRIFVATPNRAWTRRVCAELARSGVAVRTPYDSRALNCDVRALDRCANARVLTLLELAVDDRNALAWRCWCGFGDYLANAPGFAALRRVCATRGCGIADLVDRADALEVEGLAADERASLRRIAAAASEARRCISELAGARGMDLLRAAATLVDGENASKLVAELWVLFFGGAPCAEGAGVADAAGLVARARARMVAPAFDEAARDAVRVGSLEQSRGLTTKLLVITGFVDGFIPCHAYFDTIATAESKRRAMHVDDLRRLYGAMATSGGEVALTAFTSADAILAERLSLKQDRVRMRDGARIALVSPSELAQAMGEIPTVQA